MVLMWIKCLNPLKCDLDRHYQTFDVNPGDTEKIERMVAEAINSGVRDLSVFVPHLGQIAGITKTGLVWAINPN